MDTLGTKLKIERAGEKVDIRLGARVHSVERVAYEIR